jgi:hypothetical protein
MKTEMLTLEAPVTIGAVTLTPVARTCAVGLQIKGILSFSVDKQPVYVILDYKGQTVALDMRGREIPIHQVMSEYSAQSFVQT